MTRSVATLIKFAIFGLVMMVLTAFLFFVFSDTRTGVDQRLFGGLQGRVAVEERAIRVRIAGIRVGTVTDVALQTRQECPGRTSTPTVTPC